MDDLDTLRAALTIDELDPEAADRSRNRLQNRINGGAARRMRTGWLTIGTGLTVAVVAAAAVAIAVIPGAPVERSGADILLAAATAAEQAPATSGTYWHLTLDPNGGPEWGVWEYWIKPGDRQWWFKAESTQGQLIQVDRAMTGFPMGIVDVTLDQLLSLPTEPTALRAWLYDAMEHSYVWTTQGPLTASDQNLYMSWSLIALVSSLPAPPEVRAAAFRALAESPGVVSLGEVPGGQGLSLLGGNRIVVDPATGRVNETTVNVYLDGTIQMSGDSEGTFSITTEWTNTLPD